MKFPGFSPHNQTNSKFISLNNTNTGQEPTSVLQQNLDHWDDLFPHSVDLDPLAKELDFKNPDSGILHRNFGSPIIEFPFTDHNLAFGSRCFDDLNLFEDDSSCSGFDFVDDLIRVADCVDSNESQLAEVILVRLGKRLRFPAGTPLERAAFYFVEALNRVISTESSEITERTPSWSEIVQTIQAHNAFAGISPIPMFSQFTANQIIIDLLMDRNKYLSSIHVVDFDIGYGGQYASLMKEIAEKSKSTAVRSLRITAVVSEDYAAVESRLVRDTLAQFAQDHQIRFQIQFVAIQKFKSFSFEAIDFVDGEGTAVLLSPAILRRLDGAPSFATDLRQASPNGGVVVVVDGEIRRESLQTTSLREEFVNILELYSLTLESLDAAVGGGGGGGELLVVARKIEMMILRRKIFASVEAAVRGKHVGITWREALWGSGMRPVSLSKMADFQAEFLLEKVPVMGFHVAKRQEELVLCWHNNPIVATSAWRF